MGEISGVDRPAQVGATKTIMKRDTQKSYGFDGCAWTNPRLLTNVKGHSHLIDLTGAAGESSYEKMTGEEYGHTHPWIVGEDGTITIGASAGHTHEIIENTANKSVDGNIGDSMTPEEKIAQDLLAKNLSDSQNALAVAKAFGELNDAQKAHYGKLDDAGKTEFMAKNATERQAIVDTIAKSANDSNPVVYTSTGGEEFRKNDDPRLVKMAKDADNERKARIASDIRAERTTLEKRAEVETLNLPGTVDVKCAVLKAIDGISDATVKTGALALLKAANDAMNPAFGKRGTSQPAAGSPGTAEEADAKLTELAKAHQSANAGMDFYTAYDVVAKANPAIFQKAVGTTVPQS